MAGESYREDEVIAGLDAKGEPMAPGHPPRMSPNVFEINEDKIYKDKCCGEFYAMFFLVIC